MTDFFAKVCDDAERAAIAEWPLPMTDLYRKAIELGVMTGARTMASTLNRHGMLNEQKMADWMAQHADTTPDPTRPLRYAYPHLVEYQGTWYVAATWQDAEQRLSEAVGQVKQEGAGWTAHTRTGAYVGLYPDQHEAAKVLVKKAGFELGGQ